MKDTNGRREIELSRRNVLASMGALGVAGALGGAGTAAFFSDEEQFEDNTLVAGELDLKVDWEEHYSDWSDDESDGLTHPVEMVNGGTVPMDYVGLPDPRNPLIAVHGDDLAQFMENTAIDAWPDEDANGIQDTIHERSYFLSQPGVSQEEAEEKFRAQFADVPQDLGGRKLIDLSDVKPGDFGEVTFSTHLFDNPGYIWLNGRLLANAENGVNEPEAADPDEDDPQGPNSGTQSSGELADALRAVVWYDDGDNVLEDEEWVYMPHGPGDDANIELTQEEAIIVEGSLREVLDDLSSDRGVPLDRDPRDEARQCFENSTTRYLGFAWWLPVDHANELQSDSVSFDLGFYAEQCRHNDGSGMPPVPEVTTSTGSGFAKLQEGYGQPVSGSARARNGDNGNTGVGDSARTEVLVGTGDLGQSANVDQQVSHDWGAAGDAGPAYTESTGFTYSYDSSSGVATFEIDGETVASGAFTPTGRLALQAKADEASVTVSNVGLTADGSPQVLDGPTGVTASDDGGDRHVAYLALDTAFDGSQSFTLAGDVAVETQSDFGGGNEDWGLDVVVE